jgi:hypothetical protein
MMAAAMDRSTTSARASRLLDDAASRGRSGAQSRVDALRVVAPAIVQTALAAALAWLAGTELVGHDAPFLAPIAAIITLGTTYGQRTRRAVEIALGVALGVLISELVVLSLGTGPLQIALVVALAMTAAVVLGGGRLLVTQAGTAACLIATVGAPDSITLERAVDALCGGAAGLVVGLVLLPIDPLRLARRWREPLLEELRGVLDDVREALAATDHDAAVDALARARGLDPLAARHLEATTVGGEIGRGSPLSRARPKARRRSTWPSATCASSRAGRCGPSTWRRTCPGSCPRRWRSSPARWSSCPRPSRTPRATPPRRGTRPCAPRAWPPWSSSRRRTLPPASSSGRCAPSRRTSSACSA